MKECVVCKIELYGQKNKYCSGKCKAKDHYNRVKEQQNTYHSQTIRALRRKIMFIEEMGGGCNICGYNKNIAALHFHHINPSEKKMKLDVRILSNNKLETLREELKKCVLLCAICHTEEHNPELSYDSVKKFLEVGPEGFEPPTSTL